MLARIIFSSLTVLAATLCGSVQANTINISIDGQEARAHIEVALGLSADLTVRFENVVGLSPESLGISVTQINPMSANLLDRLPAVTNITVPSDFPLMITIHPPIEGGLSFEGMAEIEIYTTALHYSPNTTLRLFKSTDGEPFRDITAQNSAGSYRARGNGGQWSDFLIVADTRPLAEIITGKFDDLQQELSAASNSIDGSAYSSLQMLLDEAADHWLMHNVGGAIQKLIEFEAAVQAAAHSGQLPYIWRSTRDLDNVDGRLRARARALKFSLGLVT